MNELDLTQALEDVINGHKPSRLIPVIVNVMTGRALLERDKDDRKLWKRASAALRRVNLDVRERGGGSGPIDASEGNVDTERGVK